MNLKERKRIARRVAVRYWGSQPAPARLGKARRAVEAALADGFGSDIRELERQAHEYLLLGIVRSR